MEHHISYEIEQAARELAKRFIRVYVTRGDSLGSLKASYMRMSCADESVSIGGRMAEKHYTTDFILVSYVGGKTANQAFKLRDIYREIEGEIKSAEAVEDFKLEPG